MPTANRNAFLIAILWIFFSLTNIQAQIAVYPALTGDELLDSLVQDYKPLSGLNYGNARDTLYGRILNTNDSLQCIYTNFKIYLPPDQDPTMAAFNANINTEHAYPRAKGAEEGMARSDMHHLFPSRINVNSDRANLPFGEVPDEQTLSWYYLDNRQSNPPLENIDAYSELGPNAFEPRESAKGDIARAMFYFYTMYRMEAELADRDFFPNQKNTLCDWHIQDPVDQEEWDRNMQIAPYQDNKPNPYILDCTLAFRAFCPERTPPTCGFTGLNDQPSERPFRVKNIHPNPFSSRFSFEYTLSEAAQVQLLLMDARGRAMATLINLRQTKGEYLSSLNTEDLPAGLYYLLLSVHNREQAWTFVQKMIKL